MITNNATEAARAPYYAVLRDEDDHVKHHQALDAAIANPAAILGALFGLSTPPKVYAALLTQTGENAPVATVLSNTLGGDVVWTRQSDGTYRATLEASFPAARTQVFISQNFGALEGAFPVSWVIAESDNSFGISVGDDVGPHDGVLVATPVLVLVFPA